MKDRDTELWECAADDFIRFVKKSSQKEEGGDILREHLLKPEVMSFLGDVNGKTILDAGCGNGFFSKLLQDKGASVTGIDSSQKMIEAAKERFTENGEANFYVAHLEDEGVIDENKFDFVIANMVLHESGNPELIFTNLVKSLKKGGKLLVSALHPAFDMNPSQGVALGHLVKDNIRYGKFDFEIYTPYSREVRYERDYTFSENPVAYYFRPVSDYVQLFIDNSLQITRFAEPTLGEQVAKKHMNIAHAYFVPRFLIIGGERI